MEFEKISTHISKSAKFLRSFNYSQLIQSYLSFLFGELLKMQDKTQGHHEGDCEMTLEYFEPSPER